VSLSAEEISARLGTDVSEDDATDILSRLGFGVAYARGSKTSARRGAVAPPITTNASRPFAVTVPTWRATKDVSVKEDVVEEVARIWGYDRIESALPSFSIAPPEQDPVRTFARRLRRAFASQGAVEAYRYAFVSPESLRALGFDPDDHLTLANPLAADKPYLVSSLVPNLLDTVAINHRAFPSVCAFEVERVFVGSRPGDEDGRGGALPAQPYHAGVAFSAQGDDVPFVELRRLVSAALLDAGVEASFRPSADPAAWMHPARAADIVVGGTKCGTLAEALPEVAARAGIDRRVAVAEMNVSELASRPSRLAAFSPLPSFPDAKRDVAFVVDDAAAYADVESAVRAASPLLASVELFDVYRGKGVGEGKKSMAIHLAFRSPDRTLSSDEADQELAKVVRAVETQFRGTIRA
jgi:phenylalanyl-tRNA synthetase beta chain